MVSGQAAADLARAQASLRATVQQRMTAALRTVAEQYAGDPVKFRNTAIGVTQNLTKQYGRMGAEFSAQWYNAMRANESVRGRYVAQAFIGDYDEQVAQTVRRAVGELFTDAPDLDKAFTAITEKAGKYVADSGRETVRRNSIRDPQARGWKRVPVGPTCDFCMMLVGRGGVYTRESARFASHGSCNCAAVPEWDSSVPEVSEEVYAAAEPTEGMSKSERKLHNQKIQEYVEKNPEAIAEARAQSVEAAKPKSKPSARTVVQPPGTPREFASVAEVNKWGAESMFDVKTLPKEVQEQIHMYTGGGYRGTNRSLRDGKFTGTNGPIQREMVAELDKAMRVSAVPETVKVSRVMTSDSFTIPKGKSMSDLVGTVQQDKAFMSTSVGKALTSSGFRTKNVTMEIIVPKGTPAIWTRPVSQFKAERELLLDRGTRLAIEAVEQNTRTGQWLIKATVVPK